jgi:hypothetical protein
MRPLLSFLRLPVDEKRLLIRAVLTVGAIRLALWFMPFRFVRQLLQRRINRPVRPDALDGASIDRVAWAVMVSSRYLPAATCLTQSLATLLLLSQKGQKADLKIGVAKCSEGKLQAHAWVETEGRIVIGKMRGLSNFSVLRP